MIHLFEDKKDDILSQLFQFAYKGRNVDIRYSDGSGKLFTIAKDILESSDERIAIYIDMIPGNIECRKIYYKLRSLVKQYDRRIIILPIVCSEYYFIRSIHGTNLIVDNTGVKECLNREYYADSDLIEDTDRKFCKNFEKYCKLILMKCVKDCAKHSRGQDNENLKYGVYYTNNCVCTVKDTDCSNKLLKIKSLELLKQYPCVPSNSIFSSHKYEISDADVIEIHKHLVDEYNSMVDLYSMADSKNSNKYKKIQYCHWSY